MTKLNNLARQGLAFGFFCALFWATVPINGQGAAPTGVQVPAHNPGVPSSISQQFGDNKGNLPAKAAAPILLAEATGDSAGSVEKAGEKNYPINAGRTAWMLVACALVLLMVPGLALFYGGMVRSKNLLNTLMLSLVLMAVMGVEWVLIGYNMAFGDSIVGGKGNGIVGWSSGGFALGNVPFTEIGSNGVPTLVFVFFQGMFAIITPALISGAIAERVKFSSFLVFSLLWGVLIYNPLAHMVWNENGALFARGVLDFAGGTVVHISAGFSALILALVFLRKRVGYPEDIIRPSSLVLTLLGAGLLWFGWFGFNAGSAVVDSENMMALSGQAFATTQTAAAAAGLAWILVEWLRFRKITAVGFASGVVSGLVGITPAAGHVSISAALAIGALAGLFCFAGVGLKVRFNYDDSLDCFGVHGIGGLFGALAVGFLATIGAEGGADQFGLQALGAVVGILVAVIGTLVIGFIVDKTMGLRVAGREETLGLDMTQHGESAFRLH